MSSDPKDLLAIEIAAVLTADVQAALAHLPVPHTPAQMFEAARESAASIAHDVQVSIVRDPECPAAWKISIVMPLK
jgi:hypothetical protein